MTQDRRSASQHRPSVGRQGPVGLRFGMFATCVALDGADDINGKPKELYFALVTFADTAGRDTDKGYPYRTALAHALGCTTKTVDRATTALEKVGLVTTHRRKRTGNPMENDANRYELHDGWLIHGMPPDDRVPLRLVARYGNQIPGFDVAAYLAERGGGDISVPTGDMGVPTPGDMGVPTPGDMGVALSRASSPEPSSTDDEALAGRSPVDGAALKAEVVGAEAEGDSVASSKDQLDSAQQNGEGKAAAGKAKHTHEQLDIVRAVRAYFPADVLNGWEDRKAGVKVDPLPEWPTLSQAILDALAGDVPGADRTAAQLGARIQQRWNQHGYASDYYAGKIRNLRGAAVAMVRPLKATDQYGCANPRCDAGVDVDTSAECSTCPERFATRKAARRQQGAQAPAGDTNTSSPEVLDAVPAQRSAGRYCEGPCRRKFGPTADPAVSVCIECQAEVAAELLNSDPTMPDKWTPADAEAYEEFAADLADEPSADELAAAAAEEQRINEEAEAHARLCAQIAAEIGTPEEKAKYGVSVGPPPF